jgi:hypothetical protein
VRFASGGTKEAATAQPRTDEVKIGSKARHVNPGIEECREYMI